MTVAGHLVFLNEPKNYSRLAFPTRNRCSKFEKVSSVACVVTGKYLHTTAVAYPGLNQYFMWKLPTTITEEKKQLTGGCWVKQQLKQNITWVIPLVVKWMY